MQVLFKNKYSFGIMREYQERANKKLYKGAQLMSKPQFFTTSSRPEHIEMKVQIDNWFDENRIHNEHESHIKRTQIYALNAVVYAGLINVTRLLAMMFIGRLNGLTRYTRDTYAEFDISDVPPGEVIQIVWNGIPCFIRRLTFQEIDEENKLPQETLLDKSSEVILNDAANTKVIVTSAVCTHLGCIPIPYLGAYNGYVCICHGSVYDKFSRVRQGPALQNLPVLNSTIYENGNLVCIEELKYPTEPSKHYLV